jgi:DNA polymerase-1
MRPGGQGGYGTWKKDLKQAVDLLRDKRLGNWSEPTWSVVTRPSQILELAREYHAAEYITGDVETDRLHWFGKRGLLCLGITKDDGSHVDIFPEHLIYDCWPLMRRLLEGGRWNWQFGMFDIKWFRKERFSRLGEIRASVHEDSGLASYALNENKGFHDLDQIAQLHLGAPKHKDAMSKYYKMPPHYSLRNAPLEELWHYNAVDLSKTHRCLPVLKEAMAADPIIVRGVPAPLLYYTETLIPSSNYFAEILLYGAPVNKETVQKNLALEDADLVPVDAAIQEYAHKHMGHSINVGSPLQVKSLIYGKMGLGNMSMSTDEDAMIKIQRTYEHPIAGLILKWREIAKRKSTYVTALLPHVKGKKQCPGHIKSDGRVHADIKIHGTTTGRPAGADPNLLNQPRDPSRIRDQYEAGPGKIFVEVDLNQAELRSLALMSGDPLLLEIYTKNIVSIHDITTEAFYGQKSEILRGEGPVYERACILLHKTPGLISGEALWKEAKIRGKAVNFGIVYGREAYSLAMEYNISIAEAQRWIDKWMDTYPGAAKFIKYCRDSVTNNRNLITMFGFTKRPGVVHGTTLHALQNEFANFPHQSTASNIMRLTGIEVQPVLKQRWDANIWLELYDAIYYEMPIDEVKVAESITYVKEVCERIPRDVGLTRIPFIGDAKVGYKWGSMKDWKGSIEGSGVSLTRI